MSTPMMKQYNEIKSLHKDCVLFFRLGDFYEMFGDDAKDASKILNITLTARNKGSENETPMCGIPFHAAEGYIAKLTKAGKKVALCEQITNPSEKGIVQRDVVRIVTPATTLDTSVLEEKNNNYLVALDFQKGVFGMAIVDLTTGELKVAESKNKDDILSEINSINVSEVLISQSISTQTEIAKELSSDLYLSERIPSAFKDGADYLKKFFNVKSLDSFGLSDLQVSISSSVIALDYLEETQKTSLNHISGISTYNLNDRMLLDRSTMRNLELFYNTQDFTSYGSLISVIDNTKTAMGGRLLRYDLAHPFLDINRVSQRQEAVKFLYEHFDAREVVRDSLKQMSDIERLVGRVGCHRASPRDLLALKDSINEIPNILKELDKVKSLKYITDNLDPIIQFVGLIETAIDVDAPVNIAQGGAIKEGYDNELDELRNIATSGKNFIAELQAREIERTSISSLKVKFNKVFGYYIEVSKTNLAQVPEDYERKQTLVNAERFITPELKEYEHKVLTAEDKIKDIESSIFLNLINESLKYIKQFKLNAQAIAELDVSLSLADLALQRDYTRPTVHDGFELNIEKGRHPVIEALLKEEAYIPNDGSFNTKDHQLILLTGPNMSGKSSYLRQTALIVLLAQIGSYVPAASAKVGLTDRIFTRVGASDNLSQGQSTFMVEMQEASNILNNATQRSLIILDELGRGTATYDGISIAWSIVEFIHNHIKAKTLFATHYHELIELANDLDYAQNYSIAVKEHEGEVVFLRKIVQGGIDKSYGIEVARLAGLPDELVKRAHEMLESLEGKVTINQPKQPALFTESDDKAVEIAKKLEKINVNGLTPVDALNELKKLQDDYNN